MLSGITAGKLGLGTSNLSGILKYCCVVYYTKWGLHGKTWHLTDYNQNRRRRWEDNIKIILEYMGWLEGWLDWCGPGHGQVVGACERKLTSRFHEMREISWLADNVLDYRVGLCFVKVVGVSESKLSQSSWPIRQVPLQIHIWRVRGKKEITSLCWCAVTPLALHVNTFAFIVRIFLQPSGQQFNISIVAERRV
jgi:hypothetical protein